MSGYSILVVDDEMVIRDGCSRVLRSEGFRVLTAANGREALEIMACDSVNVILCDLKMPVMGAIEVLEQINTLYSDVPVIIITGQGTIANAVECMKKGAYDFVTKPFRMDHVILMVKRALEKQSLERRARQLQEERAKNLYDLVMEQSRIRTIINCMVDGVLVTNRDLEVVLYNPAMERLLDCSLLPDQCRALSDCLKDDTLLATLKTLVVRGDSESTEFISQEWCKGQTCLRALSALVYGPDRQVLGTVTVLHDITSLKQLDEMKSHFVRMVSHELRSPLAAIQQQHAVILDGLAGDLTEKQKEILSRSHAKIRGLLDLINDLLDLAKIESGHEMQQQVPLNLGAILDETVKLLGAKAETQNISLELELASELPLIQAHSRSMEELFTNLISNAVNYSPDGGKVTVSAVPYGNYVQVRVSDTGVGIAPEEISKIFDKFYRVKHPKTRQVIGTGLGLAIVKGIIEAHRGSVEVESEPGVGTSFRVLLPIVPGEICSHAQN